jgi:hypothetical protein
LDGVAHVGGAVGDDDIRRFQGGDLFGCRALASTDYGSSVPHAFSRRKLKQKKAETKGQAFF